MADGYLKVVVIIIIYLLIYLFLCNFRNTRYVVLF